MKPKSNFLATMQNVMFGVKAASWSGPALLQQGQGIWLKLMGRWMEQGRMGENFSLSVCKTDRDIPQATYSCNCSKRWRYKELTQGGRIILHAPLFSFLFLKKFKISNKFRSTSRLCPTCWFFTKNDNFISMFEAWNVAKGWKVQGGRILLLGTVFSQTHLHKLKTKCSPSL